MLDAPPEHPPADAITTEAELRRRFAAPDGSRCTSSSTGSTQLPALHRAVALLVPRDLAPGRPRRQLAARRAPGFVQVLGDRTLAIPDRPGNNRLDSQSNIIRNPNVGLLFFIPGVTETLRVNGRATITADAELLARFEVRGRAPKVAIVVAVAEAFLHCSKALIRSRLWQADAQVDRKALPSLGRMIADVVDPEDQRRDRRRVRSLIERNIEEQLY